MMDDVVLLPATEKEAFALSGGAELWRLLTEARTAEDLQVPGELLQSLCDRGAVQQLG